MGGGAFVSIETTQEDFVAPVCSEIVPGMYKALGHGDNSENVRRIPEQQNFQFLFNVHILPTNIQKLPIMFVYFAYIFALAI